VKASFFFTAILVLVIGVLTITSFADVNQKDDGQRNQKDGGQQNQKDDGQANQYDNGQANQKDDGQRNQKDDGQQNQRNGGQANRIKDGKGIPLAVALQPQIRQLGKNQRNSRSRKAI